MVSPACFQPLPRGAQCLLALTILSACAPSPREHVFSFGTMGTVASCRLMLPAGLAAGEAETLVRQTCDEVDTALSTWSPDSETSRLNRAPADSVVAISPLLSTCLVASRRLQENSGGAFDPTAESLMRLWGFYRRQGELPSARDLDTALADLGRWRLEGDPGHVVKETPGTRFDFGGIAKGLAVDLATNRLRRTGLKDGLIDLGGNLYCLGGAPGRNDWRVGIRNPHNRDEIFATVTVSGAAVATSGSYERFVVIGGRRYGHIMNPATGRPAAGLLSATVIAGQGLLADGLSTTLFVLGPEAALPFLREHYGQVEAVLVVPGADGQKDTVLATRNLEGRLSLAIGFEDQFHLVFEP